MDRFGSLDRALRSDSEQLCGALGDSNRDVALAIAASHRLVMAALFEEVQRTKVSVGDPVFSNYLIAKFRGLAVEELHAMFLDGDNGFIREDIVSVGNGGRVETRLSLLFRKALEVDAKGILLMHNHPSQYPYPSMEDVRATHRIVQLASALDLRLIDHLIIAGNLVTSMRSEGLL